jgi:membrane protein YqaA with SNARE-associated domain
LAACSPIAFVAATILPAQSEAALVALLLAGDISPWLLIAVASAGNVLGAVVNWFLGRGIDQFRDRPWFPPAKSSLSAPPAGISAGALEPAAQGWLPIGGDALTVVAGVLREPLWSFVALVTVAKTGRYIVLAAITLGLL